MCHCAVRHTWTLRLVLICRRRGSSMILLVLYGPRPHGPTRNVSPLVPSNVFVFMGYCKCASLAAATPAFF